MKADKVPVNEYRLAGVLMAGIPLAIFFLVLGMLFPILAGILYAVAYFAVCVKRPQIALLILFASAPFNQDLANDVGIVHMSLAELNIAVALPVCLMSCITQKRPIRIGPMLIPVLLYFATCIFSSTLHWHRSALISLLQMAEFMVAAVIVFSSWLPNPRDYRLCFEDTALVGSALALMGIFSGFSFPHLHKNAWGASLGSMFLITLELWLSGQRVRSKIPVQVCLLLMGGTFLLTMSRGAWFGATAGACVLFAVRRQFGKVFQLALLLGPLLLLLWFNLSTTDQDYAFDLSTSRWNVKARIVSMEFAEAQFKQNPVWGTGLGLRKEYDSTNLVLVTLAETGIAGLIGLLLVHVSILRMGRAALKVLPRNDPLWSNCALALALILSRFLHGCVDHYWSRGALMQAWAAVGMMVGAYYFAVAPKRGSQRSLQPPQSEVVVAGA